MGGGRVRGCGGERRSEVKRSRAPRASVRRCWLLVGSLRRENSGLEAGVGRGRGRDKWVDGVETQWACWGD